MGSDEVRRRHAVLAALSAGDDPRSMAIALMRAVAGTTTARSVLFLAHDADRQRLEPIIPAVTDDRVLDVLPAAPLGLTKDGLPQSALRATDLVEEPSSADRRGAWRSLCESIGIHAALAMPLRSRGRAFGAVVIGDPADDARARSVLPEIVAECGTVLDIVLRQHSTAAQSERLAEKATLSHDLVAIVSHELRTPLTSIIGSLQTLTRPELAPQRDEARHLVDAALTQTDRLRTLVDDLLMASRLDRRVLRVRVRPVDVAALLRETLAGVPGASDTFTISVADDLPRALLDADHLTRILRNLIENTLRHAPGSSGSISAGIEHGTVKISVVDDGPGLPDGVRARLFDRLAPPAGRNGGLGLGLAIARGLADAMDAVIRHVPTEEGTRFEVRIPLRSSPAGGPTTD